MLGFSAISAGPISATGAQVVFVSVGMGVSAAESSSRTSAASPSAALRAAASASASNSGIVTHASTVISALPLVSAVRIGTGTPSAAMVGRPGITGTASKTTGISRAMGANAALSGSPTATATMTRSISATAMFNAQAAHQATANALVGVAAIGGARTGTGHGGITLTASAAFFASAVAVRRGVGAMGATAAMADSALATKRPTGTIGARANLSGTQLNSAYVIRPIAVAALGGGAVNSVGVSRTFAQMAGISGSAKSQAARNIMLSATASVRTFVLSVTYPASLDVTEDEMLTALRRFILSLLPLGVDVIRGQENRVAEPGGADFIVMTPLGQIRLSTNRDSLRVDADNAGFNDASASYEMSVQLDIHGPRSANFATLLSVMFRDAYAFDNFAQTAFPIRPLFATDAHQAPFINGEGQYEDRWVMNAELQSNPTVSTSTQYATNLRIGIIEVDTEYPPEGD